MSRCPRLPYQKNRPCQCFLSKQKACHAPFYQRVARRLLESLDFYIFDVALATLNPSIRVFFGAETDGKGLTAGRAVLKSDVGAGDFVCE